jgi:hypothetical protein
MCSNPDTPTLRNTESAPAPTPRSTGAADAGAPCAGRAEEAAAPASSATHRTPIPLGLTKRQSEALAFIAVFIALRGYSPSYAEICAGLALSPKSKATAHAIVHQLADRGALVMAKGRAHSIALTRGVA